MEKTREKDKVKMEDITLPYLKKIVHIIMTKTYGKEGYRQIDFIRKILRKLKCEYSLKSASRVRTQLRNWIINKHEMIRSKNIDSKKGILSAQSKKETKLLSSNNADNKSDNLNKESENKSDNLNKESENKSDNLNKELENKSETQQCACTCKCINKNTPDVIVKEEIIDLTKDNESVKIEDDDMYDINAVISQLDSYNYVTQPTFLFTCTILE